MKLKSLAIVAAAILLVALAGALARHLGTGRGPASEGRVGQPLITPGDLDNATRIRFATGEVTSTLRATPDQWVVEEQYDFAADPENLSNLLFKLAELKFERVVGRDASSYAGVGALLPSENGGKREDNKTGIEFSVLDDKGQARLHYVFGSRRQGDGEGPAGGQFVRDLSDGTVYLISGSPRLLTKPEEWIHIVILSLEEKKDIKSFSVRPRAKPGYVLHRVGEPPEKVDFDTPVDWTMDNAPASKKISARAVGELAKGIGDLFMLRVADPQITPAQMGTADRAAIEVNTFNGLRYLLTVTEKDDKDGNRYMTAEAALDPQKGDEKAKQEAERYNRMFKGRTFVVNGWSADRILVPRDNLFE